MKSLLVIIILFLSTISFSQNMEERTIGEFSELKVFDLIEVTLIKSDINKVEIKGINSESVIVENEDGLLKLRMETEDRFDGNSTFVTVYYTSFQTLDANEGSKIASKEVIVQNTIDLKVQEGAMINVHIEVNFAKIKAVSGGIIETSGNAKEQDININSGGIYNAKTLISEKTDINVTSGGNAEVYASEEIDANVTAGGKIFVYGNPNKVDKKRFAGGKIKIMD